MASGQILVAEHEGVFVIRMVGDVRLTLCVSFDEFIESMLHNDAFCNVLFDLTRAQAIDSTTLGLMAKISIGVRTLGKDHLPMVISDNPSINRILLSMGFDDIFQIVDKADIPPSIGTPLKDKVQDHDSVKTRVLEAHHLLMELNESNRTTFKELVETLENT